MVLDRAGRGGGRKSSWASAGDLAAIVGADWVAGREDPAAAPVAVVVLGPTEFNLTPNAAPRGPFWFSESWWADRTAPAVADLERPPRLLCATGEMLAVEFNADLEGNGSGWLFLLMAGSVGRSDATALAATGLNRTGPVLPLEPTLTGGDGSVFLLGSFGGVDIA